MLALPCIYLRTSDWHALSLNPLTTEFFPPRQPIFMHSAHTTFIGTPLPQHSLLSGQTWWGSHTSRAPSGNTVNDIHDPPQAQQLEVIVDVSRIFAQDFPKLGPDLTDGTPYTINLHVFLRTRLRPLVGSMNLKKLDGTLPPSPLTNEGGDCRPPPPPPPLSMPPLVH